MRIVHVLPTLALRVGGPAVFVAECAAAMKTLGVDSRIFTTDLPGPAAARAQPPVTPAELPPAARSLDATFVPVRWPHRFAYAPSLRRAVTAAARESDLVVIHSLFLYPQYAGWRAAETTGTPYVVTVHGALDPYLRRRGRLRKALIDLLWQRRMLGRASALQFATEEEAALVSDVASQVRRIIVPLGIDASTFAHLPDGDIFRRRYLDGHEGPIVLALGRLARKKGLDVLIRAFAAVADRHSDAILVLAGPDDEGLQMGLEALAEGLGIGRRVVFTGMLFHEARLQALAAATVWALSSHTENFAIAAMEALAARVPVIVSPAVNLAPRLEAAGAAVVAEATPAAFAPALDELLRDPHRRAELGRAGRAFTLEYDWPKIAARTLQTYEDLLAHGRAARGPRQEQPAT